ncbi:MAG: hypothetical protein L0Z62_49495 [Gemmataceae bacterium]|nr:hypothetical protein [Gemmataceae bacterium]
MFSCLRVTRISLWVGTACALAGIAVAAGDLPVAEDSIRDRKEFFPRQKYEPLPGKVIGVLAAGGEAVLRHEGRSGPPEAFCLGVGSGSYCWVYVPVKKKPRIGAMLVPVGEKGQPKRFDSLSLADAQTVKQWGITAPFTLVEVEVNGGLGSPAKGSFVATQMKVLDGTQEYPVRVAELVEQLRRRHQQWVAEQDQVIRTEMLEAQRKALKDKQPTGPREQTEFVYVTWLPERQQLRVRFQTQIRDGWYQYTRGEPKWVGTRRAGYGPDRRYGISFGVELATAFEVDKTGQVEQSQQLPVQAFQKEIRRPPEDPGDRVQ